MANTTEKFESLATRLSGMSAASVKAVAVAFLVEALVCTEQFRTAHALNRAVEILEVVTGGKNMVKYLKEVSPFSWSKSEGFSGKMRNKRFTVADTITFGEWAEQQKEMNKKTEFQKVMAIIDKESFRVTPEEAIKLIDILSKYKA